MVGHVEWVESVLVDRVPAAGQIAHGAADWSEPAGGGAVAAVQLGKLAGACDFFTALGDDELGRRAADRIGELGVTVDAEWFGATRRAFVQVDANGERTITTVGEKLRRRRLPAMGDFDAVFFVAGEPVEPGRPVFAELEHLTGDLPPKERAAVVLRYGYDLPYDQIGAALGSSEEAARAAASSGVRRLRRLLNAHA